MAIPLIDPDFVTNQGSGILGRFTPSTLIWSDEFGGASIKADRWVANRMVDDPRNSTVAGARYPRSLVQVNVDGHDDAGNVIVDGNGTPIWGEAPQGKRHAIWYHQHRDQVQYIENGRLVMRGLATTERDPTIDITNNIPGQNFPPHPYFDNRPNVNANIDLRNRIYGSWIQGADAFADEAQFNIKRMDPATPLQCFRYGYFEFDIDFREMQRGDAFRVSVWLMPACKPTTPDIYENGVTYNGNATTGAEIDIFEYENANDETARNYLLMKVLDGGPGGAPELAPVDARDYGFNLRSGIHTIGLWWAPTHLAWYLNGVEVNRDTVRIPKIAQTLYITREGNTSLNYTNGPTPYPPYRQRENGYLYGDNIGKNPALINTDVTSLGYMRIWQDPALDGAASNVDTNWRHDATFGKIDPETPGADEAGGGETPGTGGGTPGADPVEVRDFKYAVHVDPITRPDTPINCSVRPLYIPPGKRVTVAWTHDAGANASFADPSALSTTITITSGDVLVDVQPNVALVDI